MMIVVKEKGLTNVVVGLFVVKKSINGTNKCYSFGGINGIVVVVMVYL